MSRREAWEAEAPAESATPEEAPPSNEAEEAAPTGAVAGERGIPSVNRIRTVQSRVSSALTVTLLSVLAGGLFFYYFANALHSNDRAQDAVQTAQRRRAQGESKLPPLGIAPSTSHSALEHLLGPPPSVGSAPEIPVATTNPYAAAGNTIKTPAERAFERRLAGPVLMKTVANTAINTTATTDGLRAMPVMGMGAAEGSSDGESSLGTLLRPTATPAVMARVLPTQRFLLPKGAFIDCTLETAINSALPGMTTCITATDTFSADGDIVLLERGTKLVGETRGQVQQGSPRLFVLWTEARTPTGVVVPLASPGTDELGRSGLAGSIDWHWWQRFGAAILITVIDGAVQAASQSHGSNNSFTFNPSQSSNVMTEVLKGTLNIAPTIDKPQGDRIQILVARDVDFRSVYALRADPNVGDP